MRVPKVFLSGDDSRLGHEGLAAFEAGYPVRIAEKLPCLLVDTLRKRVSSWPSRALGSKNPSWVIQEDQLKPGTLIQQADAEEFRAFLKEFYKAAACAVGRALGLEDSSLTPDRVTWRPNELATTVRRWNARDDLFHLDSFPSRPALGRRILRLFYNASYSDCVVWSHTFNIDYYIRNYIYDSKALDQGSPAGGFSDSLMAQIHDQMKREEEFQEKAPRILHSFAPGEAWIVLSDTCLHSFLRGDWLMDVSWFTSASWLTQSKWSPKSCFERLALAKPEIKTPIRQVA